MKKLELFVSEINEGRRPGSKNKPKTDSTEFDKLDGKPADKNGTEKDGLKFGVNEPIDNDAVEDDDIDLNDPDNTSSVEDLIDKFDAEEDFFIVGRAGWGKTSIIRKLAKKYKRDVITVYLDKAEATDLGGIPVPVEGNKTKAKVKNALGQDEERDFAVQIKAMPSWAKIMLDNPDRKFLLFFDEMNQAAPDVMNALMPIVLEHEICEVKFDNFFVGAAGNFEDENGAVNELSGPLKSRFKPLIIWESGGSAWKPAFKHLHKKWDKVLGKDFVDKFEQAADVFENPREIEMKIFDFVAKIKKLGDTGRVKADKYLRRLQDLAKDNLSRTEAEKVLPKLADAMVACITTNGTKTEEKPSNRKNREMIPENIQKIFKDGMRDGYIQLEGDDVKYGISKENIIPFITDPECIGENSGLNAEMIQNYIEKLEEDGLKFMFNKNEEWEAKGYEDPLKLVLTKNSKPAEKAEKTKPTKKNIKKD